MHLGERYCALADKLDLPLMGLQNAPYKRSDKGYVQFPVDLVLVVVPPGYVTPAARPLCTLRPGILSQIGRAHV